jgi:alkaline phosphatase
MRALHVAIIGVGFAACGGGGGTPDGAGGSDGDPGDAAPPGKRVVILMIGDGMGPAHVDATSLYEHGALGQLFVDSLPHRGNVVTAGPSGTTDSAAAATTMASGVRTWNGSIGLDRDAAPVETLVEVAHRLGLQAGVVSTSAVPHATPAGFSAHRDSRHDLSEIADDQALVVRPDVMLGGGARYFLPAGPGSVRTDDGLLDDLEAAGYAIVRTSAELAAAPSSGPIAGLFADEHLEFSIHRPGDTTEPTLSEMALVALDRLDAASPDGFFLMIEGARIDMASHQNQLAEMIGETAAFDRAIYDVASWASGRDDVTLLVTADHECGGLAIVTDNGAGSLPDVTWRWGQHTNADVAVWGAGPGTDVIDGALIDHRTVHAIAAARLTGDAFTAPPGDRVPDGRLDDLALVAASQINASGFGEGYNQLDDLRLGADAHGLAIGVGGVFEIGKNAVVILVDVDFGAGTGPARLDGALDDQTGRIDAILSNLSLDDPGVAGFGADVAIATWGAEDPWIEQTVANAGLRGLRPPYGQPDNLGWFGVATNFRPGAKAQPAPAPPTAAITGAGFEAHVPWSTLYPPGVPVGATLAIAVVLVNDDGGYTSNQALPPFPAGTSNPGRTLTALPGVVTFTIDGNADGIVDEITASTTLPLP